MSDYRRYYVPGGMYFLTLVTCDRQPILTTDPGRGWLRQAIRKVRQRFPFELFATVLLPDHWHLVMELPAGEADYSLRVKRIKEEFTNHCRANGLREQSVSPGRKRKGERGFWQSRFWEHLVSDEDDLEHCVNYIHWNPRKHALVQRVQDWPWSSFHRFVQAGDYDLEWGGCEPAGTEQRDWGEPV